MCCDLGLAGEGRPGEGRRVSESWRFLRVRCHDGEDYPSDSLLSETAALESTARWTTRIEWRSGRLDRVLHDSDISSTSSDHDEKGSNVLITSICVYVYESKSIWGKEREREVLQKKGIAHSSRRAYRATCTRDPLHRQHQRLLLAS